MKDLTNITQRSTNITQRSTKKASTDITKNLKKQFMSNVTPLKSKNSILSQNHNSNTKINSNNLSNTKLRTDRGLKIYEFPLERERDRHTDELAVNILENSTNSYKSCKSQMSNKSYSKGDCDYD